MGLWQLAGLLIEKLPIERLFVHERESKTELEIFADSIAASRALCDNRTEAPAGPEPKEPVLDPVEVKRRSPEFIKMPKGKPTTEETVAEVKEDLLKEMARFQNDLVRGGRIAGKPCDCLKKHSVSILATVEELLTMDSNPAYDELIKWLAKHDAEFTPVEADKHEPEYYHAMLPEFRRIRKKLFGSNANE
jgi:hypothetical protein